MIKRALLILVVAIASFGFQPPMESSLGQQPVPPVVGMTGEAMPPVGPAVPSLELWKYAIAQGGLALVAICMFWWVTRELQRQKAETTQDKQILVAIVEKTTAALVNVEATNARLARALEAQKLVPPGLGANP